MSIALIYARSANDVIGLNNTIPWHLPEDLARFKQLTTGCAVVMGRRTWDSLPEKFKPLKGRTNIVVTRQSDWSVEGTVKASSLEEALIEGAKHGDTVWVMGGAQIYEQALPKADRIEMTILERNIPGDAFAPALDKHWIVKEKTDHVSANGEAYSFVSYIRQG